MATNCKRCGAPLSPKDKFCPNCGQYAAPTITQQRYEAPQTVTPPLTPSSRLGAAFWLGLVGAIFGLLIGALMLGVSTLSFVTTSGEGWAIIIGVIVFSILGIVGPLRIFDIGDANNALLMAIAGVGILACIRQLGILSALLFFIGAALLYMKKG